MVTTARVDNERHRDDIQLAREFIFLKGYGIKSKAVEDLLGNRSLVPIKVCDYAEFCAYSNMSASSECLLGDLFRHGFQLLSDFPRRCSARFRNRRMESNIFASSPNSRGRADKAKPHH